MSLALSSPLPSSGDAGSHVSAAQMPEPLPPFQIRPQWGPDQSVTRGGRRAPHSARSPPSALDLSSPPSLRAPLLFLVICLMLGGIWKSNSQQPGKRIHISFTPAAGRGVGEARGARKRRCDMKVKAHVARLFISDIICICHSDFRGNAYADLPGIERDASHIPQDATQILMCGACIENRKYSGSTFYSAAV